MTQNKNTVQRSSIVHKCILERSQHSKTALSDLSDQSTNEIQFRKKKALHLHTNSQTVCHVYYWNMYLSRIL